MGRGNVEMTNQYINWNYFFAPKIGDFIKMMIEKFDAYYIELPVFCYSEASKIRYGESISIIEEGDFIYATESADFSFNFEYFPDKKILFSCVRTIKNKNETVLSYIYSSDSGLCINMQKTLKDKKYDICSMKENSFVINLGPETF